MHTQLNKQLGGDCHGRAHSSARIISEVPASRVLAMVVFGEFRVPEAFSTTLLVFFLSSECGLDVDSQLTNSLNEKKD